MSTSPSLEGGTRMTPVGLDIPPDIGQQDWQQVGMQLGAIRDASAWALGDWLVFGERAFGENLVAQAVEVTGRSKATLVKYRWVAEHIPTEQRWVGLSFTHHEIVARLPVEIAHDWLEAAYREGWSVEELRGHVRPDKPSKDHVDESAARIEELKQACYYLAGFDVAGWDGHMRPDEVLLRVGLNPGGPLLGDH